MSEFAGLLTEVGTLEANKAVAEHINSNPDDFLAFVEHLFGTSDYTTKNQILNIVDHFASKLAIVTVNLAMNDENNQIRVRGLQAAYRLRIDSLNELVATILNDQTQPFESRKWSIHILGSTDSASYAALLRRTARSKSESVELRNEAIFALTRIVSDETMGLLCALLGDSVVEIRRSVAWSLNTIQSPDSINCLLAALEDEDEEVRDWAIRALRDMDDTRALEKLSEALLQSSHSEQVRMIQLIVERRSEVILRAIVTLLDSDSIDVRRVAAWALGVSPYPPAVPSLRVLLDDEDEEVQSYARIALIRSGGIDSSDLQI